MKNQEKIESILLKVSKQQKDAITTAAKAAGMNVSEYIRSRAISHRASFPIIGANNEFCQERPDGTIWRTDNDTKVIPDSPIASMVRAHTANGYHPDCVICKSKADAWKAEITASEEERADYDATIRDAQ